MKLIDGLQESASIEAAASDSLHLLISKWRFIADNKQIEFER